MAEPRRILVLRSPYHSSTIEDDGERVEDAHPYRWASASQAEAPRAADGTARAASRVLLITADAGAERLVLRLAGGMEVERVLDAGAAYERARGARFDLAVIAVSGADPAGLDERALGELRQRLPDVPLLALVSSRDRGEAALARGAHAFAVTSRLDGETFLDAASQATHVHRLGRELHAVTERLLHADRLTSLGQLTAGVAHEINNPTTSLLANLTAMKDQLEAASQAGPSARNVAALAREWAEILDESLAGVGQLRAIARDLRDVARREGEDAETAELGAVIKAACQLTRSLFRRPTRLIVRMQPVPTVQGDHGKLVQVFTNLLTNAAQAIDGCPGDNEIRVLVEERGGEVVAAVEDTGCGIPDDHRQRVFAPFFTTKPRDVGTGLGLALSAEIVHRYGGDIGFAPLPGRGTRFEVRLRPDGRPSARASERAARPRPGPVARARVLLVDDEPSLVRAFRRVLAPWHDVVMAASGQQALELLERDTGFDAVICDFAMPDIDGVRIYEAVARRDRALAARIVFCTGGPVSRRGRAFIEATANTVLDKPVPPELLLAVIEQLGTR